MKSKTKKSLLERVQHSAKRWLDKDGSVGILDIFRGMGFLESVHYEGWKKGLEYYPVLDTHIQCGDEKRQKTIQYFLTWAHEQKLESFQVTYQVHGRHKTRPLRLTDSSDPKLEQLFCTRFRRADLTDAQKKRVEKKVTKVPDLLVYVHTGQGASRNSESSCSECDRSLEGEFFYLEESKALCLDCADMAHLSFLPSGNATLTRRAKKFSPLTAVVLQFNKRRKRYDRKGLLVTEKAIDQAEASLDADADSRARQREKAAERRDAMDNQLVKDMTALILEEFCNCPRDEAALIAIHTAKRGSGRVGRSAAGRTLEPDAIRLAVRAWIRHQHTDYDSRLMQGIERMTAREQIRQQMTVKVDEWMGS